MARMRVPLEEDELKKLTMSELRKEYIAMSRDYKKVIEGNVIYCHSCNEFHLIDAFYTDKRYSSGVFPQCKKTLLLEATDYDRRTGSYIDNREKTIEVFRKLDLPFIESIYTKALNTINAKLGEKTRETAYQHMLTICKSLKQYNTLHFKDSVIEEYDEDDDSEDFRTAKKSRAEIKKIFGQGFAEVDYLYLQTQYDDWKKRTQIDSKSQETYIVQICFKQLEIWKAQKEGKDTDKLVKSLNDLMNGANLQPRQNVSNAATDSLTFGQLIEKWEMEKPIPEPSEEFKDVDGIGKYIRIWFAGHLSHALGLKNAYAEEYEEYIKQYKVTKPEVQEEGSSDEIYDFLFGKVGE